MLVNIVTLFKFTPCYFGGIYSLLVTMPYIQVSNLFYVQGTFTGVSGEVHPSRLIGDRPHTNTKTLSRRATAEQETITAFGNEEVIRDTTYLNPDFTSETSESLFLPLEASIRSIASPEILAASLAYFPQQSQPAIEASGASDTGRIIAQEETQEMASTPNSTSVAQRHNVFKTTFDPEVEDEIGTLDIGDVFTIAGRSMAQIDGMTMVVMAKSSADRFLCLGLKCRPRLEPKKAFCDNNAFVTDTTCEEPERSWSTIKPDLVKIKFDGANETKLRDDCWLSYEHLYTLREVDVLRRGRVINLLEIFPKFLRSQRVMWEKIQEKLRLLEDETSSI